MITGTPDPTADTLFTSHPRWRGGDDGYSVPLGDGRSVWFLADAFVAEPGQSRAEGIFVNNVVGVQDGDDPRTSTLKVRWRTEDGRPIAYFTDPTPGIWLWPGHGAMVDDALIVFSSRVRSTGEPEPWGFAHAGWTARLVSNPLEDPDLWDVTTPLLPPHRLDASVGMGAVLVVNDFLYAFAPSGGGLLLSRWALTDVLAGDLRGQKWWTASGWEQEGPETEPFTITDGAPEFTVHWEPRLGAYLMVECRGMDHGRIVTRTSPELTGPWSEPQEIYIPVESGDEGRFLYAGKAHPQLTGADLWITYVVNDHTPTKMVADESIYWPRFVALQLPAPP